MEAVSLRLYPLFLNGKLLRKKTFFHSRTRHFRGGSIPIFSYMQRLRFIENKIAFFYSFSTPGIILSKVKYPLSDIGHNAVYIFLYQELFSKHNGKSITLLAVNAWRNACICSRNVKFSGLCCFSILSISLLQQHKNPCMCNFYCEFKKRNFNCNKAVFRHEKEKE